ncbi:pre-mRNA-splicing factor CWC21 [Pseudanabaena sp. PCC 6802]|uniref:pre-mRNA-splicing factor CWC21 n=1 Tax=Pseudanabaena sp. PCC 6802 TaxID=118173 RepID=UPI0003498183|nr:hypothetical protein [Pseudanabaena sp. PCC 6802]
MITEKSLFPTPKFAPLRKNCPICQGIRRDCRINRDSEIVHCRHDISAVPGFQFIGQDKIGFNMWIADDRDRKPYTAAPRSNRLDRNRRKASAVPRLSLSLHDRDRAIQILLAQLDLNPAHRQNLSDRGLSDDQIDQGMFRSVAPGQPISHIDARLAGIDPSGQKLLINQAGIICPIWDVSGQIVGWQTRFDRDENGKYRWPTSRTKQNPKGATAHLPNGEMPLTCCRPDQTQAIAGQHKIGLAEGFLKPYIAAQKLKTIVIGAAGGNFSSSPQTLKTYLDTLSAELSTKTIQLYPDAGAIANFNVLRQYQKAIALVTSWGYEIEIAWWGQADKSDRDIDELPDGTSIDYITPDAFFALCSPDMQRRLTDNTAEDIGMLYRLKLWLGRAIDRYLPHQGFEAPQPKPPKQIPTTITYKPGKLPRPQDGNCPEIIIFKPGQRLQLLRELVMAGWQHILDRSAPGTGKSHEAGTATPGSLGARQLFYFSHQHRNPTVATIESHYTDLPVRHNGMKLDRDRQTPSGKPWQVWPQGAEKPDTTGNCFRTPLFHTLRSKNIPNIESADNPICATCHLQAVCQGKSGDGFGFRHGRREALQRDRVRAHPDSAPNLDYDWGNVGIFWDEAIPTISPTHSIAARLTDIDRAIATLATELPDRYQELRPAFAAIRARLNGELDKPYYGWSDRDLKQALGEVPANIADILAEVAKVMEPDLNFLEMPDGIDVSAIAGLTKAEASLLRSASQSLRQADYQEAKQQIQERLLLNWLVPFLLVWSGQETGALRIDGDRLTITTRNNRHGAIARAARWNCYQDATATTEYLGLWLGISPQQIIAIAQALPQHDNLEVIQVGGLGLAGKNRSEVCDLRINALKQSLQEKYPDLGVIDWKAKAKSGDGAWFVTSRGSNSFETRSAIASFGIPYTNIGSLADRYIALTGQAIDREDNAEDGSSEFQAFVQWTTNAEILQAVGRLRAHLRPEQKLTFYFCADYDLPAALKAKAVRAVDITPKAGTNAEQLWLQVTDAFQKIYDNLGRPPTQAEITDFVGIKQSYLSKLFTQFAGGWKEWLKIFQSLLDTPYRFWNISDPDYQSLAEKYLPILAHYPPTDLLKEFCDIIAAVGWQGWQRILGLTAFDTRSRLARAMINALT